MIDLHDIRYVRLGTRDLEGAVRYAHDILGLAEGGRSGNAKNGQAVYLRSDARDHTLVYFDGDPRDHTVGFDLRAGVALDAAAAELERLGHPVHLGNGAECAQRRVEVDRGAAPRASRDIRVGGPARGAERGHDVDADLVAAPENRRPHRDDERGGDHAFGFESLDGPRPDACCDAAPSGVHRSHRGRVAIDEQNGHAIGGPHGRDRSSSGA